MNKLVLLQNTEHKIVWTLQSHNGNQVAIGHPCALKGDALRSAAKILKPNFTVDDQTGIGKSHKQQ